MWKPRILFAFLSLFAIAQSTIISDTGCTCATTKTTTTTPNASSTIAAGCSFKTDWNGQNTEWCLTDQTYGTCGTYQPGFGYEDSCETAGFSNIQVQPPPFIEWDQTATTIYTGQTINITWDSTNIGVDEWVRIQYPGTGGTRTLTTGSGTNITNKQYSIRLSDNSNMLTTTASPITLNLPSTAAITNSSLQSITVLQSKLMNVVTTNNNVTVTSGQTLLCDNGYVAISWRGLGQAQFGIVGITIKSGFGTTVGTPLSNLNATANMTAYYQLPRSFNPNGGSTYTGTITVQEPGQTAYTATTVGFRLSAAPSTSPTPTPSNTPSKTPTPSPSNTPSNSPTPSVTPSATPTPSPTRSQTPTGTPSQTPTISTTPSAAPSLDIALIARNAASAVDTQTPAIAGALGGIGGVLVLMGGFKWYQQKVLTEKRKRKLSASAKWAMDAHKAYGVHSGSSEEASQPNIVMYTVQNMPYKNSSLTTKKGFTPVSRGSSV